MAHNGTKSDEIAPNQLVVLDTGCRHNLRRITSNLSEKGLEIAG